MLALAEKLKKACDAAGMSLAVAESCTGGLIGGAITEIAGSSSFFHGSVGTYSNGAKTDIISVPAETIRLCGAVSSQCAIAMAEGAMRLYRVDLALSVTGIAGPDGGSMEKPVGLVWFGIARGGRPSRSFRRLFTGDRSTVRLSAVTVALESILKEASES